MNSKEIYAPILSLSRVRGGSAGLFSGTVARRKIVDCWVIHHSLLSRDANFAIFVLSWFYKQTHYSMAEKLLAAREIDQVE